MPYNNNVPLANQRIAATQVPIRNNFAFLQTDIQVEHSFNGNSTAREGSHLQTSMPGQAVKGGALPTGTNGVYYVDNATPTANAQFYDGQFNWVLNNWRAELGGTVTFSNTNPTSLGLAGGQIPNQVFGVIYFYGPTNAISTSNIVCCQSVFITSSNLIKSQPITPTSTNLICLNYGDNITTGSAFVLCKDATIFGQYYWTLFYRPRG